MKAADRIAQLEAEVATFRAELALFKAEVAAWRTSQQVTFLPIYPTYSNVPSWQSWQCPSCGMGDERGGPHVPSYLHLRRALVTCFMVAEVDDCWQDGGVQRVGAMTWWNHERDEHDAVPRPMPHLAVMTPAGLACLDCPDSDPPYGYWTRTGEPPVVTVTPSLDINHGQWHGFLTDGVLTP